MSTKWVTRAVVDKATARWEIEGFSWLSQQCGHVVTSGNILEVAGGAFRLNLYPGGYSSSEKDMISLLLECTSPKDLTVKFSVTLVNQHIGDDYALSRNDTHKFFFSAAAKKWVQVEDASEYRLAGWKTFIARSRLTDSTSQYVKDDHVVLVLTVSATNRSLGEAQLQGTKPTVGPSTLSADLWALLQEGTHADLIIQAGPEGAGEKLHAHRLLLASRSPVFAAMLYGTGMQEAAPGAEVSISDAAPDVVQLFLHCLYTDEIRQETWEDDEVLCHLLALLHKYQVRALAEHCEDGIIARLSEENCAERLMMADLLNISRLRACALDFMTYGQQRLSTVQATEGFAQLVEKRPQLMKEILARVAFPAKRARSDGQPLPENLQHLRVPALKQLLSDRGLPATGTKQELLARLRDHAATHTD